LCAASDAVTTASDDSGVLQEITVTARRQNEDLEKIPVSVNALPASVLAEEHVIDEQELQMAVPGLLTVASTSTNQLAFSIRGQALDAYSYTSPTVLTYFDEFQTGGISATTFFDLQSVQVLKGPQGTLFGRNATGGAVLYTTTQPGKELEGYFNYTAGNFNEQKVEGAVTIPLAEWASVRFAAEDEHRNGYEQNLYLNVDEGSLDNRNFRATVLLTPLDALQNTTTLPPMQLGLGGQLTLALVILSAPECPPCLPYSPSSSHLACLLEVSIL
jgi:iron complex outermembrane receptor protein